MSETERWPLDMAEAAFHEAGHAVVCYAIGRGAGGVKIRSEGLSYGGCFERSKSLSKIDQSAECIFSEGIIRASGPSAQRALLRQFKISTKRLIGDSDDRRAIKHLASLFEYFEHGDSKTYRKAVRAEADKLIRDPGLFAVISLLAGALLSAPDNIVEPKAVKKIMMKAGMVPGFIQVAKPGLVTEERLAA